MKRKYIAFILIIVLLVVVILAIRDKRNHENSGVYSIGVITPLTGDLAFYGEDIRNGILAADVPESIHFIFEDEQCDAAATSLAAQKLLSVDKVKFILGPACGSPQEAIAPILSQYNALAMVSSAASTDLFEKSNQSLFNAQYSLQDESTYIAEQMYKQGYRKVVLVTYQNDFSYTHREAFKKAYQGKISDDIVLGEAGDDLKPILTQLMNKDFDAIYAPDISFFFSNGMNLLKQYQIEKPVFGTYVVELPAVRDLVEDVTYSYPDKLEGDHGAIYEIARQSAEILAPLIIECKNDTACVREKLMKKGMFDEQGIYNRPIILKKIKNKIPIVF